MTDEFDGIFDHLNPDDFNIKTTAVVDQRAQPGDNFETFLDSQLLSIRSSFTAARNGAIVAMFVLQSDTVFRAFASESQHETLGSLVERVTDEARIIQAKWCFMSLQGPGVIEPEGTRDPLDADEVGSDTNCNEAIERGAATSLIYWYAARVVNGEFERKQGIMPILSPGQLGEAEEISEFQVTMFDGILPRS